MSISANIINQISSINGATKPQGFDINDDTFAKILEGIEGINKNTSVSDITSQLGAPAGFEIEPFDAVETVNEIQNINDPVEIKDIDLSDHFTHLLKNSDNNSDFMNFAKKQAANAYNMFGKNFVANLGEFLQDSASMI